jgi:hypothetical protein
VRLYGSGRTSRETTVVVDRYDDRATWIEVGAGTHVPTCGWTDDLVGAKVSCCGLLIATGTLVPPTLLVYANPLGYRGNDWLAEVQLAIESSSMAETSTLTQRVVVIG